MKERYEEPQFANKNQQKARKLTLMDELHTLLQFMVFPTRFFSQKILKNDMCQKVSLSIWTSCFGHVQGDWIVQLDLVILTGKLIDKLIVDNGPFD